MSLFIKKRRVDAPEELHSSASWEFSAMVRLHQENAELQEKLLASLKRERDAIDALERLTKEVEKARKLMLWGERTLEEATTEELQTLMLSALIEREAAL